MTRLRPALLSLALLVPLAACGGASSPASSPLAADGAPASAAAPGSATTTAPSATAPSAGGAAGRSGATATAPQAAAPQAAAPGSATTGSGATGGSSTGGGSARPAAPAPAAKGGGAPTTAAGRYTYDVSGTVTAGAAPRDAKGTATLTVDKPVGSTQSSVLEGDQGRTETDTLVRADGRYVSRLQLTTPLFSKEFRLSPAALALPFPATVGRRWTFSGTSTDGKTRASGTSQIVRTGTVTVGTTTVRTVVVKSSLALRGDITYDGSTTTDVSPEKALVVRDHGTGKGSASGFAFSTDVTSLLRSIEPA